MRNVSPSLLAGFGSLLLVLVATALTGITQIRSINSEMDAVLHQHNQQISLMTTMRNAERERSVLVQSMLLTSDRTERNRLYLSLSALSGQYSKAREQLLSSQLHPQERELLQQQNQVTVTTDKLQNLLAQQLLTDNDEGLFEQLTKAILPSQRQEMALMDQFIALQQTHGEEIFTDTEHRLKTVALTLMILLGTGIAIGSVIAILVIRRIQRELTARSSSELRERIIRENILDGIITTNAQGVVQSVNLAISIIFGYETDELIGKNIESFIGDAEGDNSLGLIESLFANEEGPLFELTREIPGRCKDGTSLPVEVDVTQVRFDGELHFIVVVRDISTRKAHEQLLIQHNEELELKVKARTQELTEEIEERRKAEEKLLYLASHDNLTGLPNRRLFMEQLELTLRRAHRQHTLVAVYFIDLDGFKDINDSHGHDMGDKLLVDVARRIQGIIRESDIASRMGGDEFTLIASDLERIEDAQLIADKLVRSLSKPFRYDDVICHVGASIGISLYPDHGGEAEQLIQMADAAMYKVKNSGKRGYLLHGTLAICQPLVTTQKA